jgi:hypothetical protein
MGSWCRIIRGSGLTCSRGNVGCVNEHPASIDDVWAEPDAHLVRWNGNVIALHRLAALAANLRMVGALQLAFSLGEDFDMACTMGRSQSAWRPGCHRTAPGWAHGEGEK